MRVHIEDGGFLGAAQRRELARLAALVARGEGSSARELSLRIATDADIAEINARFLGRPWPTDVISFPDNDPMPDGSHSLGDIIISRETAARNARRYRHALFMELRRLVVHGTLHLLGHSHAKTAREARNMPAHRAMKKLEKRYLSTKTAAPSPPSTKRGGG